MKILLTGGAGFIGSHLAELYLELGHSVVVLDNFSSGKLSNLKNIINDIHLINIDILDKNNLYKKIPKDIDLISHHAAQLEILKCMGSPEFDLDVNTKGTLNLFEWALENKVKYFINASSACVYGNIQNNREEILYEDKSYEKPNWPYGVSKLATEYYSNIYTERGMNIANLRYGIIFGSKEWYGRVLTIFLKRAIEKNFPVIFGKETIYRDFTHIFNVKHFHTLLLNKITDIKNENFNVSTGIGTSIVELAKIICNEFELDSDRIIFEDLNEGQTSKIITNRVKLPLELKSMILSTQKASDFLNYKPITDLETGIKEQKQWLQENIIEWSINGNIRI